MRPFRLKFIARACFISCTPLDRLDGAAFRLATARNIKNRNIRRGYSYQLRRNDYNREWSHHLTASFCKRLMLTNISTDIQIHQPTFGPRFHLGASDAPPRQAGGKWIETKMTDLTDCHAGLVCRTARRFNVEHADIDVDFIF